MGDGDRSRSGRGGGDGGRGDSGEVETEERRAGEGVRGGVGEGDGVRGVVSTITFRAPSMAARRARTSSTYAAKQRRSARASGPSIPMLVEVDVAGVLSASTQYGDRGVVGGVGGEGSAQVPLGGAQECGGAWV